MKQLILSSKSQRSVDQPISYFMKQAVENPLLISLAAGLVDAESLPGEEVRKAVETILTNPAIARAALQYGTTQGCARLREVLTERAAVADGKTPGEMGLSADDGVITTGSQQLLYLVSEALLDPSDIVITAAPSYFVYQGMLQGMGVRILTVPNDDNGMDTDALATLLAQLERTNELKGLKLIYVVDYFDNPTGVSLSMPRRQQLLELTRKYSRDHRILILEDAAYRELRYDGEDLPSIRSLDASNEFVILAMTFSKPLSPGLKTGYAFLPTELREPVLRLKGSHDFGSNNFTQFILHELLKSGAYDRHVAELQRVYRHKRDVTLDALASEFPAAWGVRWRRPAGGMYVWLSFPPDIDTGLRGTLVSDAIKEAVLYVPGEFCYASTGERGVSTPRCDIPHNEMRLCFGVATPKQIEEAIKRLARAVANQPGMGHAFEAHQGARIPPKEQVALAQTAYSEETACCYLPGVH